MTTRRERWESWLCGWRGSAHGWTVSLLVHLSLLCLASLFTVPIVRHFHHLTIAVPYTEPVELAPQRFAFNDFDVDAIGADPVTANQLDLASLKLPAVEMPPSASNELTSPLGDLPFHQSLAVVTGVDFAKNFTTQGQVGVGGTSTYGAVDRLTHEILLSLEERPTLVVWLLDQSPSLVPQRTEIRQQLERIYSELGTIQATGRFSHYEQQPLLSSVIAFGQTVSLLTQAPTDNVPMLQNVFASLPRDDSGVENIYEAIITATERYRGFRRTSPGKPQPSRNVMIIAFSDESGDDQHLLDEAVNLCTRYKMPVYVVGVPAPFGQVETMVKWVDPDPTYDQSPRWAVVNQGPESLMLERIKLAFAPDYEYEAPLDSGFGPFGLTRLAFETGGIYFALHPNRGQTRVRREQVRAYSAHLSEFFDEEVMRRYQPDYVTEDVYRRSLRENACRGALVTAAAESWIEAMDNPRQHFIAGDPASFVEALTEAQKVAARLEPQLNHLMTILLAGREDRQSEASPRWQAGYDLALGRASATLVRTRAYNAILAEAKKGLEPRVPRNNTWTLLPGELVTEDRQLQQLAEDAETLLRRVVADHPDTPWASLAERELQRPLGWNWVDSYTPPANPTPRANSTNRRPRNDRPLRLPRPVKRPVPRL